MTMAPFNMTELLGRLMGNESVELLRRLGRLAFDRETSAYVVGGVVRDALLGIASQDLDIVVEEDGTGFAESAAGELGGSVKAHTRFGTAIVVLPGGRKIDVASARSESYERPGALPTVASGDVEQDLKRRDFTINSMAVSIAPAEFGELVDLYGGARDLEQGVLRVLTDRSFADDPTRVLRGVRFSARFGFPLEEDTERLLRQAVRDDALSTVSGERIMNEIELILKEREPWPAVERLAEWGILDSIQDGWNPGPGLRRAFERIDELGSDPRRSDAFALDHWWRVLFLAMIEPLEPRLRDAVLERLRAGRALRDLAGALETFETRARETLSSLEEPRPSAIYRSLAGIPHDVLALRTALEGESDLTRRTELYISRLRVVRPSLDGGKLAELGVPEGRAVGVILDRLLDARLDGAVTDEREERELAAELAKDLDALNNS